MSKVFMPGGIGEASYLLRGKMSTCIQKYPSGRFGLVGSVPAELTKPDEKSLCPGARKSMVWETEGAAIADLLKIGITRFQLPDCSWFDLGENEPLDANREGSVMNGILKGKG